MVRVVDDLERQGLLVCASAIPTTVAPTRSNPLTRGASAWTPPTPQPATWAPTCSGGSATKTGAGSTRPCTGSFRPLSPLATAIGTGPPRQPPRKTTGRTLPDATPGRALRRPERPVRPPLGGGHRPRATHPDDIARRTPRRLALVPAQGAHPPKRTTVWLDVDGVRWRVVAALPSCRSPQCVHSNPGYLMATGPTWQPAAPLPLVQYNRDDHLFTPAGMR
jgi:hypothetical protein